MLNYAKQHPEIEWIFKPHPLLRLGIQRSGFMSDAEIDKYYQEWESIASHCYDSDYQDLFLDSRAMITDCGSFLSEYGATGRPVIRLISSVNIRKPIAKLNELYESYYQVHDLEELRMTLELVVENGQDPAREKRLSALEKTGLGSVDASANIVAHLKEVFKR